MIFPRRRWAIRVIEKAGFATQSREGTILLDLLVQASKQNSPTGSLPTAEQVLTSALRMVENQFAIIKVAEALAVSPLAAETALARLPQAAIAVAAEHGMKQFVEIAIRQRPQSY
jgi:hypothetical protein